MWVFPQDYNTTKEKLSEPRSTQHWKRRKSFGWDADAPVRRSCGVRFMRLASRPRRKQGDSEQVISGSTGGAHKTNKTFSSCAPYTEKQLLSRAYINLRLNIEETEIPVYQATNVRILHIHTYIGSSWGLSKLTLKRAWQEDSSYLTVIF